VKTLSRRSAFLLLVLLFWGCSGDVVSKLNDESIKGKKIASLEVVASDPITTKIIKDLLILQGFRVGRSEYKIFAEHRSYKNSCNNALIKSSQNTQFDGMVYIELLQGEAKLFYAFMDYRGDPKSHFATLVKTLPITAH